MRFSAIILPALVGFAAAATSSSSTRDASSTRLSSTQSSTRSASATSTHSSAAATATHTGAAVNIAAGDVSGVVAAVIGVAAWML
ncbi:hypothetical protein T440DRAFT_469733 [Plenodomus tracheiphilus IPT5]|uniref:Uncharacterized protein n=1 Tax=Plenodomus tracheiphilus IPT5 TaxID=1408161 RepID=A0A6A7B3S4_9PLEO|nr:hypothetical protein T440DRAFT_469733 [Plenodomus tracheiphilus IPT5]